MKFAHQLTTLALLSTVSLSALSEALPAPAQEIPQLLQQLGSSSCQFNRNGTWYSGREAQDHLNKKYEYAIKKTQIKTTEQFIELAASKSSMSGKAYLVKCPNSAEQPSQQWLSAQLQKLRTASSK